jgi:Ribonuclease G/E
MSRLGLVEITRRRTINSTFNKVMVPCEKCGGSGYMLNEKGVITEMFFNILKELQKKNKYCIINLQLSNKLLERIEELKKMPQDANIEMVRGFDMASPKLCVVQLTKDGNVRLI